MFAKNVAIRLLPIFLVLGSFKGFAGSRKIGSVTESVRLGIPLRSFLKQHDKQIIRAYVVEKSRAKKHAEYHAGVEDCFRSLIHLEGQLRELVALQAGVYEMDDAYEAWDELRQDISEVHQAFRFFARVYRRRLGPVRRFIDEGKALVKTLAKYSQTEL